MYIGTPPYLMHIEYFGHVLYIWPLGGISINGTWYGIFDDICGDAEHVSLNH